MIEARNLVKWYGPTLAVDDITFSIPKGQIVGFLGPNGAGKSTTLRILTGYMPPTSGSASIDGHDVISNSEATRARIGYMPEGTPLYGEMKVSEYLDYRGKLFGLNRAKRRERTATLIDRCGLTQVQHRNISALSKGNRQRVGVAQALLHEPPVLILDEPTAGLDPNQITHVRELITELRGRHTVLLSSHILPEVEKTADRVMIIAGGRLVAQGTPDELRQQVRSGGKVRVEAKGDESALKSAVKAIGKVKRVEARTVDGWCRLTVTPEGKVDLREAIGAALAAKQTPIREMRFEAATLEAFFNEITNENTRAPAPQESQEAAAA